MSGLRLARRGVLAGGLAAWTPASLPGLVAWYKADAITGKSDGDAISQWDDLSGNDRHLTQATGANQPTYKTNQLNGLPAVRFDGVSDYLAHVDGASYITGATLTLVLVHIRRVPQAGSRPVVCRNSAPGDDYSVPTGFIIYSEDGTYDSLYRDTGVRASQAVTADVGLLSVFWFDGTNANQRFNGAAASTPSGASTGSFDIDHLVVGTGWVSGTAQSPVQDDICEICLYDNDVGAPGRTALETYTDRWGL